MSTYTLRVEKKIFSVSEITRDIRGVLEENFSGVWIEGEITNFKFHTSGHMYFSLKDESAQIQCVMFKGENQRLDFDLKEGLSVLCFGRVSVYPVRGQYQLYVEKVEPQGLGVLQLRFLQLKEKLQKEGLFDAAHKKEIPYLPSRIGIVTSLDGAALRDILNIVDRRFSNVEILVYPAQVQGDGAAESITEGITGFNEFKDVDVLIVGRGGGSPEDLWAFNEEIVARAIFISKIPVISAVGHEIDFTIADFVADLRAPTPSAAAEMVVPLKEELFLRTSELRARLLQSFGMIIKNLRQELKILAGNRALKDPLAIFEIKFQKLDELKKSLRHFFENFIALEKEKFFSLVGKLEALGPLATLKRGFSVSLRLPEEKVITSFRSVRAGDLVRTNLNEGFFVSQVKEIHGG